MSKNFYCMFLCQLRLFTTNFAFKAGADQSRDGIFGAGFQKVRKRMIWLNQFFLGLGIEFFVVATNFDFDATSSFTSIDCQDSVMRNLSYGFRKFAIILKWIVNFLLLFLLLFLWSRCWKCGTGGLRGIGVSRSCFSICLYCYTNVV